MEQAPRILTLEQFSAPGNAGLPTFNNFFVYFSDMSFLAPLYKAAPFYQRFAAEHEQLAARLNAEVQEALRGEGPRLDRLEGCIPSLYEAYVIMKGYGCTDEELFK